MCLVGWLGQGCAGSPSAPRIACGLCEEPGQFVRLQAYPSHTFLDTQRRFAHPFNLSPEDWRSILASVHIQPRVQPFVFAFVKGKETPVFTPEEVDFLSLTLNRAFTKATPEDLVVFALSQPGPPNITELTTGGWYTEGTKLHLLLANYRAAVSMCNIREVLDRDPLFEVTGSNLYEFAPSDFAQKATEKSSFLSVLKSETPHLVMDYNPLLKRTTPHPKTHINSRPESGTERKRATLESPPSIEERLERLKQLEKKGLITKEDYDRKKQELLDQL